MSAVDDRLARARENLKRYPTLLLDRPHPDPERAAAGHKMRSKVSWLLEHAGVAGKTRACLKIEEAVRRIQEPQLPMPRPGANPTR
ncbi:MAG: hypothetical protein WCP82_05055 [Alphaproteobacteria bacterium]